jgi:hypothetical protein
MNKFYAKSLAVLAGAMIAGGCSSMATDTTSSADAGSTAITAAELEASQRRISELESSLKAKDRDLANAEARIASSASSASMDSMDSGNTGLMPSNPKPGECYARVIIPAKYTTTSEQVLKRAAAERIEIIPARYEQVKESRLVKEASTKLEVIPAKYETVEERVLVKPATTKLTVVPAVYETIEERVLVKPASTQVVEVPAVYKTETETVLDQPARTEWKRGTGVGTGSAVAMSSATQAVQRFGDFKVIETRVEDTGDLMCLVEIPATYKTIEKQVLVSPATTRTVEIPAEYKTVKKTVLKTPATTREVTVPAEYRTVKVTKQVRPETTREVVIPAVYGDVEVTKLVQPATERRIPIPAEYTTLTRNNKVSDERTEWRPVLCEVNMTRENVAALQTSLNDSGCCKCGPNRNECQIDGVMGPCTLKAAQCYAERNGLSSGDKYVTMDVIRALGLKF